MRKQNLTEAQKTKIRQETLNNGVAKLLCDPRINEDLTIDSFSKDELNSLKKMIDDNLNDNKRNSLSKNGISSIINEIKFFGEPNPDSTIGTLYTKLLQK